MRWIGLSVRQTFEMLTVHKCMYVCMCVCVSSYWLIVPTCHYIGWTEICHVAKTNSTDNCGMMCTHGPNRKVDMETPLSECAVMQRLIYVENRFMVCVPTPQSRPPDTAPGTRLRALQQQGRWADPSIEACVDQIGCSTVGI
jgi:hypothetical protein